MEAIFLFYFIEECFINVELISLNLSQSVAFSCGCGRSNLFYQLSKLIYYYKDALCIIMRIFVSKETGNYTVNDFVFGNSNSI